MPMITRTACRTGIVAIAPVVLLMSFVYHPHLPGRQPNVEALAAAVTADETRWGLAHLAASLGSGLLMLAILAVRSYLREAGEERWSAPAVPFIVIGSTMYAVLPGMELTLLGVAGTGGDVQAVQRALLPWFIPVLVLAGLTFAIGIVCLATGIAHSRFLGRRLTRLVAGGLVVMAAARFVPLSVVQFYVQGVVGIVALWPLAYEMWKHPHPQSWPAGEPLPAPVT
jgi:hypothetical protein